MVGDGGLDDDSLVMWTVYDSPPGYPGQVVAKCFAVVRGATEPVLTGHTMVAPSLEWMRRMIPPGLALVPRSEGDDPAIVETWM